MKEWVVKIKHDGKWVNYSSRIGSISWTDSTDQLGAEFTFSMPFSKWDSNFKKKLSCGDIFLLKKGDTEVLRGVITEIPVNGSEYKGYDFAWYLNQSETIVQFKKISAKKAIEQLCKKYDVPYMKLPEMNTQIKKVYKDETIANIIADIIEQHEDETDKNYRIEMKDGKLHIFHTLTAKITPHYWDEYGKKHKCTETAEITGTKSIENLRNYIIYANKNDKKKGIKAIVKSSKSIKKYGLLSDVTVADNLTSAKARQRAKNRLSRLNKITTEFSVKMMGSIAVRAGRKIEFDKVGIGISGWYKIKSVTHHIENGIHTCEMEMTN